MWNGETDNKGFNKSVQVHRIKSASSGLSSKTMHKVKSALFIYIVFSKAFFSAG